MAEHFHRHRPVQHRPAAQEGEHRADRDVGAQCVAVAAELVEQPGVDLLGGRHTERGRSPQLEEQREERAGEHQRAFVGDVVPPVVQAGQRHAEQQAELGLMVQRPAAELAAGRDHLEGQLRGHLVRRRLRRPGGLDGPVDIPGEFGEDAGDDVPDQLLVAAEVPVEAGRCHAHLTGDGAQRDRVRPVGDQQPPRRGDDLLDRRRAQPVPPGRRRRGAWHRSRFCPGVQGRGVLRPGGLYRLCHNCLLDPVLPSGTIRWREPRRDSRSPNVALMLAPLTRVNTVCEVSAGT